MCCEPELLYELNLFGQPREHEFDMPDDLPATIAINKYGHVDIGRPEDNEALISFSFHQLQNVYLSAKAIRRETLQNIMNWKIK